MNQLQKMDKKVLLWVLYDPNNVFQSDWSKKFVSINLSEPTNGANQVGGLRMQMEKGLT